MGFGTIPTSLGFLTVIALTVAYLTLRPVSRTAEKTAPSALQRGAPERMRKP